MNDQSQDIEKRISERTDLTVAGSTAVSSEVGGLAFRDMGQVMEFSKLMAVAGQAIPGHLRNKPGACLAVSLQALNWRMDPFAVANKSYMVNDRIAYEAQLVHAVIEQRAPIEGRIKGKLSGEGGTRKWTLTIRPVDDDPFEFEGQEFGKITTKNSPLWKSDPDQQLWYYTVRAMCRRHFPDVILGVYEREELRPEAMRDVTPVSDPDRTNLAQRIAQPQSAPETGETIDSQSSEPEADEAPAAGSYEALDTSGAFPGGDTWQKGVDAYIDGVSIEDCPYEIGLPETLEWLGGWKSAREEAEQ